MPAVTPHADITTSDLHGRSYLLRALYGPPGRTLTVPVVCLLWAAAQLGFFVALAAWEGVLTPDQVPGGTSLVEDTTALGWYALLPGCSSSSTTAASRSAASSTACPTCWSRRPRPAPTPNSWRSPAVRSVVA